MLLINNLVLKGNYKIIKFLINNYISDKF